MKVVVDVNVWISALLWKGRPRKILQLAQNQQITIFASDDLFLELETTLNRAKFANQIKSLGLTLEDIIDVARRMITFCPDSYINIPELRDAEDNKIIAAALTAKAEVLITGDLDLLTLKEFAGILILTPADFLNAYFPL